MSEAEPKTIVEVCLNLSCTRGGSERVLQTLQQSLKNHPNIEVRDGDCLSQCEIGPNVFIAKAGEEKGIVIPRVGKRFFGIPTKLLAFTIRSGILNRFLDNQ